MDGQRCLAVERVQAVRGPSGHGVTGSASLPPGVSLACCALCARGSAVVTGAAESAAISRPALCLTGHTRGGGGGGQASICLLLLWISSSILHLDATSRSVIMPPAFLFFNFLAVLGLW